MGALSQLKTGVGKNLVLAVILFTVLRSLLEVSPVFGSFSPIWPATGIAQAILVRWGVCLWPGVALANLALLVHAHHYSWISVVGIVTGNTLEALIPALLLRRMVRIRCEMDRVQDVFAWIGLASVLGAALSAVPGVSSLVLSGRMDVHEMIVGMAIWWFANAMGSLLLGPFILVWSRNRDLKSQWSRCRWEGVGLLAVVIFTSWMIFGNAITLLRTYLIFPIVIWAALRFGQRGVVGTVLLVTGIALIFVLLSRGPFVKADLAVNLLVVQVFLGVLAITGMVLAAAIMENHAVREKLNASRGYILDILNSSQDMVIAVDPNRHITEFNKAACKTFGYRREEVMGRHEDILYQDPNQGLRVHEILLTRGSCIQEVRCIRKSGQSFPCLLTASQLHNEAGEHVGFMGISRDITTQQEMLETQRKANQKLALHVQQAPLAVIEWNLNFEVMAWNPTAEVIFGYTKEEALGRHATMIVPVAARPLVDKIWKELLAKKGGARSTNENITKDGRTIVCEWYNTPLVDKDGEVIGVASLAQDITQRKQLEVQLLHAQKMESVGQLAGGVAHDFNNFLTAIIGYAELALARLPSKDVTRAHIEQVLASAQRASDVTRQLLAFARRQVIEVRVIRLNDLVLDMDKLLRRLIGEDVELSTILESNLWNVRADPGQMEQLIVNLVVNARDAMPQGGCLILRTENVRFRERDAEIPGGINPGEYVMFAIRDTGLGMSEETKQRIFEPFFTTKERGKGIGLGLATCYGVVHQSAGHIRVESEVGKGTEFRIYLPRVMDPVEIATARPNRELARGGSEIILLAEDEGTIRGLTAKILREQGYTVLEAGNGVEALQLSDTYKGEIHLLLTDVVMPKMGGWKLAGQIVIRRPKIKVLYTSGYTDDAGVRLGVLDEQIAFLQKPFTPYLLTRRVRERLDAPS